MLPRRATAADLPAIRQLFYDTITQVNRRDYGRAQIEAWRAGATDAAKWRQELETQYFVVLEVAGRVAGFASLTDDGWLDYLFVHHAHQRRGLARALLLALEAHARQLQLPQIQAQVSLTARPFFAQNGFEVVQQQEVLGKAVAFVNLHMVKSVGPPTTGAGLAYSAPLLRSLAIPL